MTDDVKIIECPRDAWQGLPQVIPAEVKVLYLAALIEAGFRRLDAAEMEKLRQRAKPLHGPDTEDWKRRTNPKPAGGNG